MQRVYHMSVCRGNRRPAWIILIFLSLSSVAIAYQLDGPQFELLVATVYGYPGQQGVVIPVLLSNSDSVGQWDVFMEYLIAGMVVEVQLCDSIRAVDPVGDSLVWYYAPWYHHPELRPEYFDYTLNVDGRENRVRIKGIMDLDTLHPVTPPIRPRQQQLLFCLLYDVSPLWSGREIMFGFLTRNCDDNTLVGSDGSTVWGPDTLSAPRSNCLERPDSLRVIRLTGGGGIRLARIHCGDLNCNGIVWEMGDLILFAEYFHHLYSECENTGCDTAWLECATPQSDMNGDAYPWTISDLVSFVSYLHYGGHLCDTIDPIFSDIDTMRVSDTTGSPGEIVSVFVNLRNTFPVCGYAFRIVYDPTLLTAIGSDGGEGWLIGHGGYGFEEPLQPGSGSIATLRLVVNPSVIGDTITYLTFEDDSVTPRFYSSLSDSAGTHVVPQLVRGMIRIIPTRVEETPKLFDPLSSYMAQSFPNPFRAQMNIRYYLPEPDYVTVEIYNCQGYMVRTLVNESQNEGAHCVSWDGKDGLGKCVSTGTYFYRLRAGNYTITKKMVALR